MSHFANSLPKGRASNSTGDSRLSFNRYVSNTFIVNSGHCLKTCENARRRLSVIKQLYLQNLHIVTVVEFQDQSSVVTMCR